MTFETHPSDPVRHRNITERVHELLLNELDESPDSVEVYTVIGHDRICIELY